MTPPTNSIQDLADRIAAQGFRAGDQALVTAPDGLVGRATYFDYLGDPFWRFDEGGIALVAACEARPLVTIDPLETVL